MAIQHIEASKLHEATVGARGSYIDDAFRRKDAPECLRIEISEQMAIALLATVKWTVWQSFDPSHEGWPRLANKEYVCIRAIDIAGPDRRQFVYQHDFSWYLYDVKVS